MLVVDEHVSRTSTITIGSELGRTLKRHLPNLSPMLALDVCIL